MTFQKAKMSDEEWKKAKSVYEFTVNSIKGEPVSLEKYKYVTILEVGNWNFRVLNEWLFQKNWITDYFNDIGRNLTHWIVLYNFWWRIMKRQKRTDSSLLIIDKQQKMYKYKIRFQNFPSLFTIAGYLWSPEISLDFH